MSYCKGLLSVAVIVAVIFEVSATFSDCGSVHGNIVSVDISKCTPSAKRCILRRNSNVTMAITFTSSTESRSLKAVVHGVVLGIPAPFDLPNSNGCQDSGIVCPVQSGATYKYVTTLPILSAYPRVTVDIKWELKDDNNEDLICALIPAKIS
ncbi:ecdysteroid-regulated 16 kDa protein-like [Euwallacea fornicatus]|uniref:ecdysteroid-regulated 16 kDa protein-like n=1 Tax=Euwallacea fornicatus TaxID=995702 RepID=UPI00338DCF3A